MKTNISENLYDFASFQAGDLRGHMQSNIWENRGRLWWTESPSKIAQKSESSFLKRKKVDHVYLCIQMLQVYNSDHLIIIYNLTLFRFSTPIIMFLYVGMTYIGLCQLYKGSKYQVLPNHPL